MRGSLRSALSVTSLLFAAQLPAADDHPRFDASLGALGDDAGGHSIDLDAVLRPAEAWSVSFGGGSSRSAGDLADLQGNQLHAQFDVHGRSFGLRPGYSRWRDSGDYATSTTELAFYWMRGGLRAELLGEWSSYSIDYQQRVLTQTIARQFDFSGHGYGAHFEYYGEHWGGYLRGLDFGYGDDIARLRALAQSPNLQRFPRLALLLNSMATMTRGALDRQLAAGVERGFARFRLHADWTFATDAVSGTRGNSYGLGAQFFVSPRFDVDVAAGRSETEGFAGQTYGSLALGFHW